MHSIIKISFQNILLNLESSLQDLGLFLTLVVACLVANIIWYLIIERSEGNVSLYYRFRDKRYNYITMLYKEIRDLRIQNFTDEQIQARLQDRYRNKAFPFMLTSSTNPNYFEGLNFVEKIINNKDLLFVYAADPDFTKSKFKSLLSALAADEREAEARNAVKNVLIDQTPSSIDDAMIWLPLLMTPPFTLDPADPDRKISKSENHFSVLEYLKGTYLEASQDTFIACLKKLKAIHPNMQFAASKSHSSDRIDSIRLNIQRKSEMLKRVEEIKKDLHK